jgi:cell envelope opacity-associated protein A
MKIQHPLVIVFVALSALFMAGCATDREAHNQSVQNDATNIYVIQPGDTVAKIARQFGISIADLEAMNPDLKPNRLYVGQKVKVH